LLDILITFVLKISAKKDLTQLTKLSTPMFTKIILGLLWLCFGLYAFLRAPPHQPDTINLIIDLSTGKWQDINPLIISLST
jgi:hypothetical protein